MTRRWPLPPLLAAFALLATACATPTPPPTESPAAIPFDEDLSGQGAIGPDGVLPPYPEPLIIPRTPTPSYRLGQRRFLPRVMANLPPPPKTATPAPASPATEAVPPAPSAPADLPPADLPPGELAARRALLAQNMGFGGAATGGLAGPTIVVTNLADSGPGSLREALETPGPAWVVFGVDGPIQLRRPIQIQSDKTVDGRGRSVEIQWRGLEIIGTRNVVVSNLRFRDGRADAVSVRKGARQVWLDHLTLSDFEDGLVDITHGASDVTVSWSRFEAHNKGMLIGANPWDTGDVEIRVTLHHLHFVDVLRRLPKLRFGRVHAFNNMIERWSGPAIELAFGGQLRLEGSIFVLKPDKSKAIVEMQAGAPGLLGGSGNDTGGLPLDASGAVFEPPYAYQVEPADAALVERLQSGAGWQP